ncbi:MAG: hypothetical protein C4308_02145 [Chitinophagaceae bacterium]
MAAKITAKVELVNPNTGSTMKIDAGIYKLISKTIYHTLKQAKKPLGYTEMVTGVKDCLKKQKETFKGSVEWYTVGVKHDMVSKRIVETWMEKGKRLHKLT